MKFLKKIMESIFISWKKDIDNKALELHEVNREALVLDLGCGDGELTNRFAEKIGSKHKVIGLEGISALVSLSRRKGIDCRYANLEENLRFRTSSIDIVVSHFSLEHLLDVDSHLSEIYRILKPGGYAVIATDNLSSWANIGAMIFGYQPLSPTPGLSDIVLGNPFALHTGESGITWTRNSKLLANKLKFFGTKGHIRVLSYQALIDLVGHKSFCLEVMKGVGYLFFYRTILHNVELNRFKARAFSSRQDS